ncbi:unnamed protein product [Pleuronectes platessa]|uniref:Uncharacterized protein n=1 Tax=Pleuronectes platessa TaxID=8262 RepID=A0A9N7Z697_PLEPL|nr:unnamed protein product [Pleuronectes platessa]
MSDSPGVEKIHLTRRKSHRGAIRLRQEPAAGRQSCDNKRWQTSQNKPRSSERGQSAAEEPCQFLSNPLGPDSPLCSSAAVSPVLFTVRAVEVMVTLCPSQLTTHDSSAPNHPAPPPLLLPFPGQMANCLWALAPLLYHTKSLRWLGVVEGLGALPGQMVRR